MTVRDVYEAVLVELNKVQAPSLLISDFVYYLNKAVQEYFNKRYTAFEKDQQATDDLSRLNLMTEITAPTPQNDAAFGLVYSIDLPKDYVHILNCTCVFKKQTPKCKSVVRRVVQGANKLDTNQASQVLSNYYMRPSIYRPYYYIIYKTDPAQTDSDKDSNGKVITDYNSSFMNRTSGTRYGNSTQPVMQILCGNDPQKIDLESVQISYLRAPQFLTIDQDQLDDPKDTTSRLEFQDYVVNEIIKEIVKMVMENGSDARLQTYIPVNQSIPQK